MSLCLLCPCLEPVGSPKRPSQCKQTLRIRGNAHAYVTSKSSGQLLTTRTHHCQIKSRVQILQTSHYRTKYKGHYFAQPSKAESAVILDVLSLRFSFPMRHISLVGKRSTDVYLGINRSHASSVTRFPFRNFSDSAGEGDGTFKRVQQLYVFGIVVTYLIVQHPVILCYYAARLDVHLVDDCNSI